MCSRKWLTPTRLAGSSRAPVLSQTPRASERRPGNSSLKTVRPFESWVRRGWQSSARAFMANSDAGCGWRGRTRLTRRIRPPGPRPKRPAGPVGGRFFRLLVNFVGGRLLRLGEQRLARKLDLALAVNADHLHGHDVAE